MSFSLRSSIKIALLLVTGGAAAFGIAVPAIAEPDPVSIDGARIMSLEEVIITAQKRSENLQSSALAVTAIDADTLLESGGQNLLAIEGRVPNVEINTNNAATGVAIRGIFSTNDGVQADPAVAYHVDGVYLGRPQSVGGLFYDIDHIEVLRGPQGTLYGRNATAGAINVIPKRPGFGNEAQVGIEVGDYGLTGFSGMGNLPLGDSVAWRTAFRTLKRDGFAADGISEDQDSKAARTSLLWNATDSLSILAGADYDSRRGIGNASYRLNVAGVDPRSTNIVLPEAHIDNVNWGAHAEVTWALSDAATLTLLPAYHSLVLDTRYATDRRIQLNQEAKQSSFEARLASPADQRVSWILGGFYWQELQQTEQTLLPPPTTVRFAFTDVDAFSQAAFAQATLAVTERLRLTGGLRYTADRKRQNGSTQVRLANGNLVSNIPSIADTSWNELNWKATLEFDAADNSMLYATAATGYKAGGNYDGLPPNSYDPEHVLSFEVGSKSRLFEDVLQLNLAAFHYDYDDYHASQLGCLNLPSSLPPCSTQGRITYNADQATVWAVEAELQWAMTAADRLDLAAAYTESEFKEFVLPVTPFSSGGDFSGNPLPKAPKEQVTLSYAHRFTLGGAGDLTASARGRHVGDQTLLFDASNPIVRQPSYTIADASFAYTPARGLWQISAYCNNITDELVKTYAFGVSTPGAFYGTYLPPRTYGIRALIDF